MKQQIITFLSFIFLFNCFTSSPIRAQKADKVLEKKIVVTGKQITIDSLLRIISRQTAIEFSFNSKKISPAKKVAVPKQSLTIFKWLQNLRQEVNIDYKLVGNHLVLLDRGGKAPVVNMKPIFAVTNTDKRNKPVLPGNKIYNSKVQNSYSAAHNEKISLAAQKNEVTQKSTGKIDADSSVMIPVPQMPDTGSKKINFPERKIITIDTTQMLMVKNTDNDVSSVPSSSPGTITSWDNKHQLTFTPGRLLFESAKYYGISIGLDYDRKLLSFGRTVNKNNTAWKRFNLNLEVGADYVFGKKPDSLRMDGILIAHLFPDIIYKFGQYAHIDIGAGLAAFAPSPAAHLGYGVNLSVNFPVNRQTKAFNKIILFGAGLEMYEFKPFDAYFLGTVRLSMLFPRKKR